MSAYSFREKKLAWHYATAFLQKFNYTDLSHIQNATTLLLQVPTAFPLFFRMLQTSNLPFEQKATGIDYLLEKNALTQEGVILIKALTKHRRIPLLSLVAQTILTKYKREQGFYDVSVSSSQPLSDEQKKVIENTLRQAVGGVLSIAYHQDKKLISGIKVEGPTFYWERSIAKTLRRIECCLQKQEQI